MTETIIHYFEQEKYTSYDIPCSTDFASNASIKRSVKLVLETNNFSSIEINDLDDFIKFSAKKLVLTKGTVKGLFDNVYYFIKGKTSTFKWKKCQVAFSYNEKNDIRNEMKIIVSFYKFSKLSEPSK